MRIKKLIIGVLLVAVTFGTNIFAQYHQSSSEISISGIGVKALANFSNVSVEGVADILPKTKSIDGFNYSVFAEIPLADNFSFQPEFSYNKKGFRVKEGLDIRLFNVDIPVGLEAHTEVKYLEMPLLGKYTLSNDKAGVYFLAGPSVSVATDAKLRTKARFLIDFNLTKTDIDLSNDDFNRWEAAVVGGMGAYANIGTSRLFIEGRYNWGLTDLMADPIVDIQLKNRTFGLGAGLQFAF